jgi:5-methylthioadenosine/S-adenosylhomocysteine deaminase
MIMRTLVQHGIILTLDAAEHIYNGYDLLIQDGVITQIADKINPDGVDKVIDASGKLVMPGLVNAHLHTYDRYMRGLYEDLPLEVWFPYVSLAVRRPLTQHEIYVRTVLTSLEMLRGGITAAYDVCTLAPLNQESIDTLMTGYRDAGIRAIACAQLFNNPFSATMPYLGELMPPEVKKLADAASFPPDADLLALAREMIEKWNGHAGYLHVGLAPSAPQRCSDTFLLALDDLSREKRVPWNLHVLETKIQAVTGPLFYGKTLVEYLAGLKLLSDRLSLIHGVWLTDHDIQLLAEGKTSVIHNPGSNLKLKSGIANVPRMLQVGVNVALGCDNNTANDAQSIFGEMKLAALLPQVSGPAFAEEDPNAPFRGGAARAALRMATAGGAKSVLLQDVIASLEVGKRADIVLLDLNSHPFVPLNDPVRQLVYSENGQSVDTVLVNGHVVMENKKILTVDEQAVLREAREIGSSLRAENEKGKQFGDTVRPYMEEMYWRCVNQDVGVNRYTGPYEPR